MWKNVIERGRPQMTVWRMGIACWIPNATNTHAEYVNLIAFPQQQRLYESVLSLRLKYTLGTYVQRHTACKIRGPYSRSAKYSSLLGCYIVSIGNAWRNNPEERTFHLHNCRGLQSRNGFCTEL